MKTVMTIVLDEDKKRFGWRLDRNESEEVVKELAGLIIHDDKFCHNDSLEEQEPIPDWFEDCLYNQVLPELKKQLKPYRLHNPNDKTIEVL